MEGSPSAGGGGGADPPPGDTGRDYLSRRNRGFAAVCAALSLLASETRSAPALGGRGDSAPGQLPEVAVEEEAQGFKLRQGGGSICLSPVSWPDVDVAGNPDVRTEQGQSR